MRPYVIRKCSNCGRWHVIKMVFVEGVFLVPTIIATFNNFWEDVIYVFDINMYLEKLALNNFPKDENYEAIYFEYENAQ